MKTYIDHSSGVPLYMQLAEILQNQIILKKYKLNELFPNEAQLTEEYNISRNTVRNALDILVDRGLIQRKAGKGTYVSSIRLIDKNRILDTLANSIKDMGAEASIKVLERSKIIAPENVIEALNISPSTTLLNVQYLTNADGMPFGYSNTWLDINRFPELEGIDFQRTSQFELIEEATGKSIYRGVRKLTADMADSFECEILKFKSPTAVFRMEMVIYMTSSEKGGTPIEFLSAAWQANRVVFDEVLYRSTT